MTHFDKPPFLRTLGPSLTPKSKLQFKSSAGPRGRYGALHRGELRLREGGPGRSAVGAGG